MTEVLLDHVTKRYGATVALADVTLPIPAGRLTAVLGPSGCGKTTILRLVAGLILPTSGDVRFDGRSVLGVPAERRQAVMVFQQHRLFPQLSVRENVGFGLRMRGVAARERARLADEMLDAVHLAGYGARTPDALSGGEQQRVALARALVTDPRVLLLDEPLSSLDAGLRDELRDLIRELQRARGLTTVVVTHDQTEAVTLADRLALVLAGRLQQVDEPEAFFRRPASLDVARFFGARLLPDGVANGGVVHSDLGRLRVSPAPADGPVRLAVRPESVRVVDADAPAAENSVPGVVESAVFAGPTARLRVRAGAWVLHVVADPAAARRWPAGSAVGLVLPADALLAYPRTNGGEA